MVCNRAVLRKLFDFISTSQSRRFLHIFLPFVALELCFTGYREVLDRLSDRSPYSIYTEIYKFSFFRYQVKKLCCSLRRNAKDERVLFHYNGHGVPKPTTQGEIWVFNRVSFSYYLWMWCQTVFIFPQFCTINSDGGHFYY